MSLGMLVLVPACTTMEDISNRDCVPLRTPLEVPTERPTYLYDENGDGILDLADAVWVGYRTSESGFQEKITHQPLAELPVGTRLNLERVKRGDTWTATGVIEVQGSLIYDGERRQFKYTWGVGEEISAAPWESSSREPRVFDRDVSC